MARIQDKEMEKAKKLAARKGGVTRSQLAEALDVSIPRAATILERLGLKRKALGGSGGKACRTLVFSK
jgi:Mn-dependent DtxR family transcriptional regulator